MRPSRASSSAKAKKPGERGKAESATRRGGDAAAVVDALRALGVDHLRVLRELERHHAVPGRFERHGFATTPACVSGDRVGAEAARASGARGECGRRRKQRVTLGLSAAAHWPWPGTSDIKLLVNGSYLRWGPAQRATEW